MEKFEERLELTDIIEQKIDKLFSDDNLLVQEFGCKTILQGNKELENYIKEPEVNQQASAMIMAQFAAKVKCLYCYRTPNKEDYDCANCPSKTGGFFDIERATNSVGSQTPMTDVDLESFEPVEDFFAKLGICVNSAILRGSHSRLESYNSLLQAQQAGKRSRCKFCLK